MRHTALAEFQFAATPAEAATAFDGLVRDGRVKTMVRQTADAWPNVFRQGQTIPAVEYLRASAFVDGTRLDRGIPETGLDADPFFMLAIPITDAVHAAQGVHRVVNTQMAEGIRVATVRRGIDPRRFALLGFGGAAGHIAGTLVWSFTGTEAELETLVQAVVQADLVEELMGPVPGLAIEVWRNAAKATPEDLGLRAKLADLLYGQGSVEEARTVLTEAVELFDTPEAWRMLASFHRKNGDPKAAREALEQAMDRTRNVSGPMRFALADMLIEEGDYARAESIADSLDEIGCKFVRFSSELDGESYKKVVTDYMPAVMDMTSHLVDLGHRNIGFISGPQSHVSSRKRQEVFIHYQVQMKKSRICLNGYFKAQLLKRIK